MRQLANISDQTLRQLKQLDCRKYLYPSKNGLYCCPLCGSGSRGTQDSDGAVQYNEKPYKNNPDTVNTWICHACNNFGENGPWPKDVLALIREEEGVSFHQAAVIAARELDIPIVYEDGSIRDTSGKITYPDGVVIEPDGHVNTAGRDFMPEGTTSSLPASGEAAQIHKQPAGGHEPVRDTHTSRAADTAARQAEEANKKRKAQNLLRIAREHAKDQDALRYLEYRGISAETAERLGIGYLPYFNAAGNRKWKAIILPLGDTAFKARNIEASGHDDRYQVYGRDGGIFNAEALKSDQPIFVVEGELDAAAIEEAGGRAIGKGQLGVDRLAALIAENPPAGPIICAFDNDEDPNKGQRWNAQLEAALTQAGLFSYLPPALYGTHKDANEFLMQEPDEFKKAVLVAAEAARQAFDDNRDQELHELEKSSVSNALDGFLDRVCSDYNDPILTGLTVLDEALEGGLYPGLYIIGAGTGAGKTSLVLQISDHIAAAGRYVLYVSLEMSRDELIAKSISRLTYEIALERGIDPMYARSIRQILRGKEYRNYPVDSQRLITEAMERYEEPAKRLFVWEGVADIKVSSIEGVLKKMIRVTGKLPVLVLDYLQIVQPEDDRMIEKQAVDNVLKCLKRLSKNYNIPVICISSFNRDSYDVPVSLKSFKETGSCEYTGNVLAGIQQRGLDYVKGEKDADRKIRIAKDTVEADKAAREGGFVQLEFKILKSRFESKSTAALEFCPKYGYFRDGTAAAKAEEAAADFQQAEEEEYQAVSMPIKRKTKAPSGLSRQEEFIFWWNEHRQENEDSGMNDPDPSLESIMTSMRLRSRSGVEKYLIGTEYYIDDNDRIRKGEKPIDAADFMDSWSVASGFYEQLHGELTLEDMAGFYNGTTVENIRATVEKMPAEFRLEGNRIIRITPDDQVIDSEEESNEPENQSETDSNV